LTFRYILGTARRSAIVGYHAAMRLTLVTALLLAATLSVAACGPGGAGTGGGAGPGSGGGGGSSGTGADGAGVTGSPEVDAGAGGAAGALDAGGAGSAGGGSDGGASAVGAADAGASGAGGGLVVTSGAGGGVFVMCDDHADFNGRGLCAPTGQFGAVVATQTLSSTGTFTTLTASFAAAKPATDPGCTQQAAGAGCVAVTCPNVNAKNPASVQAGAITAKSSGGTLVTTPDATGAYDRAGFASELWTAPTAALTFSAAGGAVPAFGDTFCGPAPATLSKPATAPGAGLVIDRSSDLALQWTGGAVGDLEVAFREAGDASSLEVRCFFTGASGQGTVPKAALGMVSAGMHSIMSSMWVRKISLPAGTCVELTGVVTNLSAAGGAPFNGSASFQ
jgi:hypothetical protein